MPTQIVPISKRQANAIAKINYKVESLDIATDKIARRWAQAAINIGEMLIAERDKHKAEQNKKVDKATKVEWKSLFKGEKSAVSGGENRTFSISYRQAAVYQSLAKYPCLTRQNAIDTGCVNIDQTAKLCSNATDEQEETARLAMLSAKEQRALDVEKNTPPIPDGQYRVIYADPPWSYGDKRNTADGAYTGATSHYHDLTIPELCSLPVEQLAADDAVLFMWTTSPLLLECMPVIEAWGFKYKASIVWDKDSHNVGHYVSVRHELLLICTRGSCPRDCSELLPSVVKHKKSRTHSEKPEVFRQMIDQMYSDGPRIELFRRGDAPGGWSTWGNQADG